MKTKLFENIEGNKFRLLKENTLDENKSYVKSGIKKVFSNAEGNVSYRQVETVGLGYIRDINTAKRFALQEAREIAEEFGYKDHEDEAKFIKDSPNVRPLKKEVAFDDEKREVQIGNEIKQIVDKLYPQIPKNIVQEFIKIKILAAELIRMHGAK
jgi:hypothetical protein